ncbi:MAG: ABC transporter permease subunit [Deltaproteobacteria bacterium]|nr:MAG: ABC transporter permease subunit [Deltaproteobacteria bacterium]
MKTIIFYELKEMIRNKWWLGYGLSFFILSSLIFHTGVTESLRASASLLNLVLLLVPLFSLVFGSISFVENMPFQEVLLAIPTSRFSIFFGKWLGLSIGLSLSFVLGMGVSSLWYSVNVVFLMGLGVVLTFIFVSISFLLSNFLKKKELIFGIVLLIWLLFFLVYDVAIMAIVSLLSDYPLEKLIVLLVFFNPIDVVRTMVTIQEDLSAMMGYSGALFYKYFGSGMGVSLCGGILILWILFPLILGYWKYKRKDL